MGAKEIVFLTICFLLIFSAVFFTLKAYIGRWPAPPYNPNPRSQDEHPFNGRIYNDEG